MYDGPPVEDADVLSVYVVLNGSLGMTPGKAASQAFHVGWLARYMLNHAYVGDAEGTALWRAWEGQGRRVVVRLAETANVFKRAVAECDGMVQRDEGLTEVDAGSATALVTVPYARADAPKVLSHKRLQLYRG
jgi:peptidyl-tRNA hydrolase